MGGTSWSGLDTRLKRCGRIGDANRGGEGVERLGADAGRWPRRCALQVGAVWARARGGAGASATPTAAVAALKAWDGGGAVAAAMGAPSWGGVGTRAPVVLPFSQAFASAALRLVALVCPWRF